MPQQYPVYTTPVPVVYINHKPPLPDYEQHMQAASDQWSRYIQQKQETQ